MDELEGEEGKEEFDFAADADVLGTGVVKPDGAKVEIEEPETDGTGEKEFEIKDSTVNITVNENHGLAMKGTGTPKGKGKPFIEEEKPSAGLSKEKRSEIVKAAKKGKDIGKKGKNFEKVKKAAEKSGATNPEAVAAAAMWRNIKRESEEEKPAMSESEVRLRKYIRARLQEKVGLRKAVLNESEKSPTIKKLDAMIDKQFELYESLNEGFGEKIAGMVNKLNQRMEGKFGKQKELKAIVDANPESSRSALKKAYSSEIMNTGGLGIMIDRAPLEDVIDVAKQAANDPNGLGKISSRAGKLIYIPANET
jgi:hypothetical protein